MPIMGKSTYLMFVHWSIPHSLSLETKYDEWMNESINQSITQSINQPTNQSNNQSINQSITNDVMSKEGTERSRCVRQLCD